MRDARRETRHGRQRAHRILVGGVAGVDNPSRVGVVGDLDRPVGCVGRNPQSPRNAPQRNGFQHRAGRCRRQVVVVCERKVQIVVGEQREGFERFVLADHESDLRVERRQLGDARQQRDPNPGGEAADPHGAAGFCVRVEVEPRGVDGGQDRDRVVGEPQPGRCQPDPPAVRFDELRTGLLGQRRDLLGHRRGGQVVGLGDRPHRTQAGQGQKELQAARVHAGNCSAFVNGLSRSFPIGWIVSPYATMRK